MSDKPGPPLAIPPPAPTKPPRGPIKTPRPTRGRVRVVTTKLVAAAMYELRSALIEGSVEQTQAHIARAEVLIAKWRKTGSNRSGFHERLGLSVVSADGLEMAAKSAKSGRQVQNRGAKATTKSPKQAFKSLPSDLQLRLISLVDPQFKPIDRQVAHVAGRPGSASKRAKAKRQKAAVEQVLRYLR